MTERGGESGWMTVWRLDTGELKRLERRGQDGGSNGTTWGYDITKESEEMQIEALERGLREELKKTSRRREYYFKRSHRRRDNAPSAL